MFKLTPSHLAAIGCFAIGCAGPAATKADSPIGESHAVFAPEPGNATAKEKARETKKDNAKNAKKDRARADIEIVGKRNQTIGMVDFEQRGDLVTIDGHFNHLPMGVHGLQIHSKGSCSGAGARKSGGDFNPTDTRHGPPESPTRHVGDLGNIEVTKDGKATFRMETDSMTVVEGGPSSVLGRTIVITRNKDNGLAQPNGNAGPAIACGVISKAAKQ